MQKIRRGEYGLEEIFSKGISLACRILVVLSTSAAFVLACFEFPPNSIEELR